MDSKALSSFTRFDLNTFFENNIIYKQKYIFFIIYNINNIFLFNFNKRNFLITFQNFL